MDIERELKNLQKKEAENNLLLGQAKKQVKSLIGTTSKSGVEKKLKELEKEIKQLEEEVSNGLREFEEMYSELEEGDE